MQVLIAIRDRLTRRAMETLLLAWGYEVITAGTGSEAQKKLALPGAPPLALVDWSLNEPDGPTLCRRLRESPQGDYVYLILVGGPARAEDPLTMLSHGADDFLPRALDQNLLRLRLRTAEHILTLQRNLQESRQALEYRSTHDQLTGAWNRSEVLGMLEREMARASREGTALSVVMIDVDYFKDINDTFGHQAGDAALQQVSACMMSQLRPYDILGRYGGEEFLLLLGGCSPRHALRLAERLREQVENMTVVLPESQTQLTISLGLAAWNGSEHRDLQALIRAADAALYQAKQKGRNRVETAWQARGLAEAAAA